MKQQLKKAEKRQKDKRLDMTIEQLYWVMEWCGSQVVEKQLGPSRIQLH